MPEKFCHQHRVTYSECTVGNHIYYSRYLDLLEEARGEFFRKIGKTLVELQSSDFIFPVVEARLRYKAPARYDDVLTIELWLTEISKLRVNFAGRIVNQHGVLLVEAETFHVCTSMEEKPKRAPEDLIAMLKPFLADQG